MIYVAYALIGAFLVTFGVLVALCIYALVVGTDE